VPIPQSVLIIQVKKEFQRNAIENRQVNNVFSKTSGVIVIVTLALAKIVVRVAACGRLLSSTQSFSI